HVRAHWDDILRLANVDQAPVKAEEGGKKDKLNKDWRKWHDDLGKVRISRSFLPKLTR
ncbi:hypothetical protein J9J36_004957, partial [Salmonella enterica]|nr:hypothetical protein [Salmonella enterica]HDN5911261.1 hypothetical protein [Salmonella enterica subsp. enterica serovar Derby]